jgi:hypothetical protein
VRLSSAKELSLMENDGADHGVLSTGRRATGDSGSPSK